MAGNLSQKKTGANKSPQKSARRPAQLHERQTDTVAAQAAAAQVTGLRGSRLLRQKGVQKWVYGVLIVYGASLSIKGSTKE